MLPVNMSEKLFIIDTWVKDFQTASLDFLLYAPIPLVVSSIRQWRGGSSSLYRNNGSNDTEQVSNSRYI